MSGLAAALEIESEGGGSARDGAIECERDVCALLREFLGFETDDCDFATTTRARNNRFEKARLWPARTED